MILRPTFRLEIMKSTQYQSPIENRGAWGHQVHKIDIYYLVVTQYLSPTVL